MAWREPEIVLLELDGGAVAEHWLDMAEKLARVSVPQLAAETCAALLRQQMGTRNLLWKLRVETTQLMLAQLGEWQWKPSMISLIGFCGRPPVRSQSLQLFDPLHCDDCE